MILVTGATGFIGNHVCRVLAGYGMPVRVLVRAESNRKLLEGLEIEIAEGDLRDVDSLREALKDCRTVYHVAADYRLWAADPGELHENNVVGTRNIARLALEADVGRFVYTSTVGCIAIPKGGELGHEALPIALEDVEGNYKKTKFEAEREVLDAVRKGLRGVVVNPTAPVGEGDIKPTPTGQIVVDFLRGRMPAYVDTGLNLVDVRDVAKGHLLAAKNGRIGERYILGKENLTLAEILEKVGAVVGKAAPRVRLPKEFAVMVAAADTWMANRSGRAPRAPLEGAKMARKKMWVSSEKAERELGFRPGVVDKALERAVTWFQENGYCSS